MEVRYGGEIYNYKDGLQNEQKSEVTSPSLAEGYLKRLAERKKKGRMTGGKSRGFVLPRCQRQEKTDFIMHIVGGLFCIFSFPRKRL
jgi:hypothetical protein